MEVKKILSKLPKNHVTSVATHMENKYIVFFKLFDRVISKGSSTD